MAVARIGALVTTAVLVFGACSSTGTATQAPASGGGGGGGLAVKIGIELPMSGGEAPNGVPTANGVARKRDEPIDVRDSGRPDQVFHADGSLPRAEAEPERVRHSVRHGPSARPERRRPAG